MSTSVAGSAARAENGDAADTNGGVLGAEPDAPAIVTPDRVRTLGHGEHLFDTLGKLIRNIP
ncbi:MAG: hypothetical protein LC795_11175 [Acidobacteria bacterium]|nr:hypothetical protein [Acidobacteriota bacterium]MCA1619852.1 hypothetical protein [Acidobacteriota bacterium]